MSKIVAEADIAAVDTRPRAAQYAVEAPSKSKAGCVPVAKQIGIVAGSEKRDAVVRIGMVRIGVARVGIAF